MEDTTLQQLVAIVKSQEFPHKDEFLDAVATGPCVVRRLHIAGGLSAADQAQLLNIYRRRQSHLAQKHSTHSQALAGDVAWFCARLETNPPGRVLIWVIEIAPPYNLDFFIDEETNKVLGYLRTVSKLDRTPEEWEQLWAEA